MQTDKAVHITWALVVILVVAIISGIFVTQISRNHQFDADCINSGKKLTWSAVPGNQGRVKECK